MFVSVTKILSGLIYTPLRKTLQPTRWVKQIEQQLKMARSDLMTGVYLDGVAFGRLVDWLTAKKFHATEREDMKGYLSPDDKWFVHFRHAQGFFFLQLTEASH